MFESKLVHCMVVNFPNILDLMTVPLLHKQQFSFMAAMTLTQTACMFESKLVHTVVSFLGSMHQHR